jgi:heptosyltransferase II
MGGRAVEGQRPDRDQEEPWRAGGPTGTKEEQARRAEGPTGTKEQARRAEGPSGTKEEQAWRAEGPTGTRNVLVVAPAWVGDMVMTQSLVAELKRRAPADAVDLLAPPYTAALGARMPGVRQTIAIGTAHGRLDLLKRVRTGQALRASGYALAIVLPGSFKSAIPSFVARIPRRRGYVGEWRFGLLNEVRRLDKKKLPRTVDRFVALAGDPNQPPPAITPPVLAHDHERARALAAQLGLALERPVIALCPGAEYGPAKQWPAAHFAALADRLAKAGFATWIFGSAKEAPLGATIATLAAAHNKAATPINLAGQTTLVEAIDLLSLTAAVATNDSGLMHVAAALRRPLVAVYGSTTADMTPPLGGTARIIERTLPCRPCFKRTCPLGHLDCLNLISAAEVAVAVLALATANQTARAE